MRFENRDQTSDGAVHFTQPSTFATATRTLRKTAVVGSHETKNRVDASRRKRRDQQGVLAVPEYPGYYTEVIKTKIEDQSSAHQIKIPHVFVLIFVNGLEPATMS